jgi:hypothetical protein
VILKIAIAVVLILAAFIVWRYTSVRRGARARENALLARLEPLARRLDTNTTVSSDEVEALAAAPELRSLLYWLLSHHERLDLFPAQYLSEQAQAEAVLVYWMMHPNELQAAPEAIEPVERLQREVSGRQGVFHVFRYRMPAGHWSGTEWQLGLAGPFFSDEKPYQGVAGGFSRAGDLAGKVEPGELVNWYVGMLSKSSVSDRQPHLMSGWNVMSNQSINHAREFIRDAELPEARPLGVDIATTRGAETDPAAAQASVVGSDVVAFVNTVTSDERQDIMNASLLAQLVARQKVAEPRTLAEVTAWYDEYLDVLSRVGFVLQHRDFAEYRKDSQTFEAHKAILDVAAVLLAGSPGALYLVKSTLEALEKMSADSPWITLFNRESQSANTAHFQVSLVERDGDAGLLLSLIAFGLAAQNNLTQVLFFKFRRNEITLRHYSGKVTINARLLAAVRHDLADRLVAYTRDYIKGLPAI